MTRGNIHDVKVIPLKQIVDERGKIMHMLKASDDHFMNSRNLFLLLLVRSKHGTSIHQ